MKIKKHIQASVDILDDNGRIICSLQNGQIYVIGKEEILSLKAAYYVVSYTPDTDIYQQFTILAKSNNYYYDCTINPVNGNKQLLVKDSYGNIILTIDGIALKNAIDALFELENIKVDDGIQAL